MIKHIVMWKFMENEEEIMKEFLSGLENLRDEIPELVSVQTGININPANEFNAILITEFNTYEDLQSYQKNPKHIVAAGVGKDKRIARQAIDFEF